MILGFSIIATASHKWRSRLILILLFRTLQFKIYLIYLYVTDFVFG